MADNPENKEEKPDLFSPSAEALGYISLEQTRVLAIRHAKDNTDFYGPRYSGIDLVWEVIGQEDGEEYYDIRLSFRPAGRFRGEPGVEQFVIDKLGGCILSAMSDAVESLLKKALSLDEKDRASIAGALIESLHGEPEAGVDEA